MSHFDQDDSWECHVELAHAGACTVEVNAATRREATGEALEKLSQENKLGIFCYPEGMFDKDHSLRVS